MSGQLYEMKVTAVGEVRDADGNLLSSEPVEATSIITQEQYNELTKEKKRCP